MTSNQTKQNIQQMEQGQKDFGILNSFKNIHKKVVNNQLISEFDVFSVPVKLTLNGNQVYQTFCGGCLNILLLVASVILTIFIMFPNGVQLNSELSVATLPDKDGDTGQTLFDHTDEIMAWRGLRKSGNIIKGYSNISSYVTFKAYQAGTDNLTNPLEISTQCSGYAQFCLKKTALNSNATIYGNYYNGAQISKYIVLEMIWCDYSDPTTCAASPFSYSVEINYTNFYKKKGGELLNYTTKLITSFVNAQYLNNVTKQIYTSNSKFFGHIANLFPFSKETYLFNDYIVRSTIDNTMLITPAVDPSLSLCVLKILPYGIKREINQNFDDISEVILFFLSVKETLYLVLFFIFVKQYNRNSGLLEVAQSLFYIDDPKTKGKYDFKSGYQVFIACLLYNHPVSKLLHFLLTKVGRTFQDILPNKSYCAIKLIKKAEQILQQNAFYGNLNELSSMESQSSNKVKLIERDQQNNEQQKQESYFPFLSTDSEAIRQQKEFKREAFEQFCEANQYISADRKNHVYKVITNKKLKHMLVHEMQKQYKQFVRNLRIQKNNDAYRQVPNEQLSQIKVAIHDTSNNAMTAENFIRT